MRLAVSLLLLALLAGCGTSDDREQARATVERFYAAVGSGDAEAACAELGESLREQVESQTGEPCRVAITSFDYEGGAIDRVQVFVTNAKVDLDSGESAFLGREPDGWRLTALACKAERGKPADRPFECEAES
jgi:hypothetical protein